MNNITYSDFLEKLKKYKKITIFRHEFPDYDAQGAQYALYHWLKINFTDKQVHVLGKNINNKNIPIFFEEKVSNSQIVDSLAIIFDVQATPRVDDQRYLSAKEIIVIDHHKVSNVGNQHFQIIETEASSTCEILANIFLKFNKKFKINVDICNCLFFGIVTDTNRFLYQNTSINTMKIVIELRKLGLEPNFVYSKLYINTLQQKKLENKIFSNAIIGNKIISYVLKKSDYQSLGIEYKHAKNYVFVLSSLSEFEFACFASKDEENNVYRVSLRSKTIPINEFALKFGGGGHKFAAGIKVKSLKEVSNIISELEKLV